jgi:DNA polymerase-3 subunit beta
MHIQFDPKEFSQNFQIAAAAAAVRDIRPILQNVKVSADKKNGVLLQATDTEIGVRVFCENCDVVNNGEAILPTKRLREILALSKDDRLDLESDAAKTTVKGDRREFELETQSPDEFPDIETFDADAYHEIPAKTFKEMIRRTVFAVDQDSQRYALNGVYFRMIGENIDAVATDGRRLAWQRGTGECVGSHKAEQAILPIPVLKLIDRALDNDDENVKIAVSANRAIFQYKHITFFSRLVEGRFPNWEKTIPQTDDEQPVTIAAGVLLEGVSNAMITTSESDSGVVFVFEKGKLILQAQGREVGSSKIEIPISYDGTKKQTKIDPKYMTDVLKGMGTENDMAVFLPKEKEGRDPIKMAAGDGYVYIVMPMV